MIKYFFISVIVLCSSVGSLFAQSGWNKIVTFEEIGAKVRDLYFFSPDSGFIGAQNPYYKEDSIVKFTTDGGKTWFDTISPIIAVKSDIPNTRDNPFGFSIKNFGQSIGRTTDGGRTWVKYFIDSTFKRTCSSFPTPAIGFIGGFFYGGTEGALFKTEDSGKTWRRIITPYDTGSYDVVDVKFRDAIHGILIVSQGTLASHIGFSNVWFTDNGGETWVFRNEAATSYLYYMQSPQRWILGENQRVELSSDDGLTWQRHIAFSCPEYNPYKQTDYIAFTQFSFYDSVGYAVTNKGRMYKLLGGGTKWIEEEIPRDFYNGCTINIFAASPTIVYASGGYLIKTIDGGGPPSSVRLSPPCDCNTKLSPEIASGAVTISFDAVPSAESIEIYDAIGRQVSSAQIPAEATSYRIDISNYASGMYLAKLRGKMYRFVKVGIEN